MDSARFERLPIAIATLLMANTAVARGQSLATVTPGRVADSLVSESDATQRYAAYLPAGYSRTRRWPVLILMDPRGRALVPMERFRGVAERLGYVVVSSYNTLSDGSKFPNFKAVDAIVDDVSRQLAADMRRVYLVGFSGTARVAWEIAEPLGGIVAGLMTFGATLPANVDWLDAHLHPTAGRPPFVVFASVGSTDPNYEEVMGLERDLAPRRIPLRVEQFDGPHAWPPVTVCNHAVEWMELQAMRAGLTPRRPEWSDSLGRSWLAAAQALEARGDGASALRDYRDLADVFDKGGADSSIATVARSRAAALSADREVRRALDRRRDLAKRDTAAARTLAEVLNDIRQSAAPPDDDDLSHRLDLAGLRRRANATGSTAVDSAERVLARRALARIQMFAGFYEPRDYLFQRRFPQALSVLRIALAVAPSDPFICLGLAQAHAQMGDIEKALEQLRCAAASGQLSRATLERDPLLDPVRRDPRYAAIVAGLRAPE